MYTYAKIKDKTLNKPQQTPVEKATSASIYSLLQRYLKGSFSYEQLANLAISGVRLSEIAQLGGARTADVHDFSFRSEGPSV